MRLMILLFTSFYISQRPKEIQFPLQLNWRCGPDMPFESGSIQSVVINGMVYVGGGWTNRDENENIVMTYDTHSGRWGTLPPYRTHRFGMTVIRDQLVLVGGLDEDGNNSKSIGVWKSADKEWVDLYPDMPTPRYYSSVVTYNEWLIVAGGYNGGSLSSVDAMNIDTKEWYSGPPAPRGITHMKTVTVGDMCYYMGGHGAGGCAIKDVYRVSLPVLISQVKSRNIDPQIWKKISPLNVASSTPLSIGGSLFALGGMYVTSIQHYRPESDVWIQVGDLPFPLSNCTCAVINDGDVLVAGGLSSTYIASFMYLLQCLW